MIEAPRLHIAIQKSGRLAEQSRELLKECGIRFSEGVRGRMTARAENFPLDLMFVRDDDIPTFVADGVCQLGIVGLNVLEEQDAAIADRLQLVTKLGFGYCDLRIAGLASEGPLNLSDVDGQRIATSYPRLLSRFLADRGLHAEIVEMQGAVEIAPRLGIARFVCDLVSSGETLHANGLKAFCDVLASEAVLVRTGGAMSPELDRLAHALAQRIDGVRTTAGSKYIVLNAPESAVAAISNILPGVEAPTVVPLIGRPGYVAVQAVCQESVFWETLEALKAAGGSGILVMPIEKMML